MYWPELQFVHIDVVSSAVVSERQVPAPQTSHVPLVVARYLPAIHTEQSSAAFVAVLAVVVPSWHAKHIN